MFRTQELERRVLSNGGKWKSSLLKLLQISVGRLLTQELAISRHLRMLMLFPNAMSLLIMDSAFAKEGFRMDLEVAQVHALLLVNN